MAQTIIENPILNSPFEEPSRHFKFSDEGITSETVDTMTGNAKNVRRYYHWSRRLVYKWINRRSQKQSYTWEAFTHYLELHPLPQPRIVHHLYAVPAAL